ncbi:MAG: hypothetical protein RDV48_29840 [Candidatus Eremiobacteraeota bacterium]|nr:hypothetical protein [Candidatus Eremiobacteraeota bacterium]MDQ7839146.1 hypothetical protein [Thermodesulfobacteriota bacterium]MDQ7839170.1 hypothetical protein [Thermodesulfobacteriota bacterium]
MNIEAHLESLREAFSTIDLCVDKGAENHQRAIGFLTSLGAAEMLELYLHKSRLLHVSARVHHEWLKSKKRLAEKIPQDFPRKAEILELVYNIEKNRNDFCYGKKVEASRLRDQLEQFNALKELFREVGLDEI